MKSKSLPEATSELQRREVTSRFVGCFASLVFVVAALANADARAQMPAQQKSAMPVSPCPAVEEYRQFDFWVGEWDVTEKDERVATSSIQKIVGGCVVFENYSQPDGYTGKSFNFYDANLHRWRQTWVDAFGNVSEFAGEFKDGAMRYEGESHRADGTRVLRKMILTRLDADRVRQYSERSLDGGKSWKVAYDYIYVRKR